ncbi:DUF7706 family protein [Serratia nevei]|uniref:DUF7706 family protein n=1 Tax=Serratia nevei TaxID=2703794 RepID=UPI003BEECDCF
MASFDGCPEVFHALLQLTHREAQALAQLVKRLGFSDCRGLATSDIEAYLMMDGINQIMKALAEEGYAPR